MAESRHITSQCCENGALGVHKTDALQDVSITRRHTIDVLTDYPRARVRLDALFSQVADPRAHHHILSRGISPAGHLKRSKSHACRREAAQGLCSRMFERNASWVRFLPEEPDWSVEQVHG